MPFKSDEYNRGYQAGYIAATRKSSKSPIPDGLMEKIRWMHALFLKKATETDAFIDFFTDDEIMKFDEIGKELVQE